MSSSYIQILVGASKNTDIFSHPWIHILLETEVKLNPMQKLKTLRGEWYFGKWCLKFRHLLECYIDVIIIFIIHQLWARADSFSSKHHFKNENSKILLVRSDWCRIVQFPLEVHVHQKPNFSNLSWQSAPLSPHDPLRPSWSRHQRPMGTLGTWESDWRFRILTCRAARHLWTRDPVHFHICCSSPTFIRPLNKWQMTIRILNFCFSQ